MPKTDLTLNLTIGIDPKVWDLIEAEHLTDLHRDADTTRDRIIASADRSLANAYASAVGTLQATISPAWGPAEAHLFPGRSAAVEQALAYVAEQEAEDREARYELALARAAN